MADDGVVCGLATPSPRPRPVAGVVREAGLTSAFPTSALGQCQGNSALTVTKPVDMIHGKTTRSARNASRFRLRSRSGERKIMRVEHLAIGGVELPEGQLAEMAPINRQRSDIFMNAKTRCRRECHGSPPAGRREERPWQGHDSDQVARVSHPGVTAVKGTRGG